MGIQVLVTVDENYIHCLKVMLYSLKLNNLKQSFDIYLLHRNINKKAIDNLKTYNEKIGNNLIPICINGDIFINAPSSERYPQEMYYRLLAHKFLPESLSKIIYLDPDIIVINSIEKLWNLNIDGYLFAAAAHTWKTDIANNINHIRLKTKTDYFNSGVLLINLEECRKNIRENEIFDYVKEKGDGLILPDQDVLNALYSNRILQIEDALWNYDVRNYKSYKLFSHGEYDMDWVMKNTVFLHFCGNDKPWKKNYRYRFGPLYKHYAILSNRIERGE